MDNLKPSNLLPNVAYAAIAPVYLFIISLGLGTLLLLLHFAFPEEGILLYIGFIYIAGAIVINIITFICLAVYAVMQGRYRYLLLLRACLLFVNLPIAIGYIYIMTEFSTL